MCLQQKKERGAGYDSPRQSMLSCCVFFQHQTLPRSTLCIVDTGRSRSGSIEKTADEQRGDIEASVFFAAAAAGVTSLIR